MFFLPILPINLHLCPRHFFLKCTVYEILDEGYYISHPRSLMCHWHHRQHFCTEFDSSLANLSFNPRPRIKELPLSGGDTHRRTIAWWSVDRRRRRRWNVTQCDSRSRRKNRAVARTSKRFEFPQSDIMRRARAAASPLLFLRF